MEARQQFREEITNLSELTLGVQSYSQTMIGMSNQFIITIFWFHYVWKVSGSLRWYLQDHCEQVFLQVLHIKRCLFANFFFSGIDTLNPKCVWIGKHSSHGTKEHDLRSKQTPQKKPQSKLIFDEHEWERNTSRHCFVWAFPCSWKYPTCMYSTMHCARVSGNMYFLKGTPTPKRAF